MQAIYVLIPIMARADLGGALGVLKHPLLKFYHVQARKLLEVSVQMQLHFICMHGQ